MSIYWVMKVANSVKCLSSITCTVSDNGEGGEKKGNEGQEGQKDQG